MKEYIRKYMMDSSEVYTPMHEIAGFPVRPGLFEVNGAMAMNMSVNFTIHTNQGTACELLLFHKGENEPTAVLPFPEEYRIGNVYSMMVFGLDIDEFEYAFHVDGPYDPKRGYLFDKRNVILDPYAKAISGQHNWGKKLERDYHARVVKDTFEWGEMAQSNREMCDLIIYELHVRGFTKHASSGVKNPGTFSGLKEKIPYLKELGINAVELMPIFEFDENMNAREVNGERLLDYWGYNTVGFFAPNSSYAALDEFPKVGTELKDLIHELHQNGIEVILDVVFNHTAEGNERGTTFCFKGLDNRIYYMLTPEGNYYNFSGCGNTLNCNNPVVQQMVLECLRYWTINYRVDGFRFDLASILGRNEDGSPMNNPPLLRALAFDPILGNVKLIAEAWDAGGMYQVGGFPASGRWSEWNGRYRDSMRSFLKGGFWDSWTAAWSIAGSPDLYGGVEGEKYHEVYGRKDEHSYSGYNSSINFFTCHDGFTLYDLYAYNEKHNEKNGWNNTDGANDNRSWNCGAEGETDDPEVLKLRFKMMRNAMALLMCSRGTPMFLAGDEFGNTKYGNNNSYCQDNEISWLDWGLLEKNREMFEFCKYMIWFRREHPIIRRHLPNAVNGMEQILAHDVNPEVVDLPENATFIGLSFAGYDTEKGKDDVVYIAVNAHWEPVTIRLPSLNNSGFWYLSINTNGDGEGKYCYRGEEQVRIDDTFIMPPRTVAVFTEREF